MVLNFEQQKKASEGKSTALLVVVCIFLNLAQVQHFKESFSYTG
jgi:hypothetical protein